MKKITTIKLLAIGVIVMGFVHIAATFSPMIVGKQHLYAENTGWTDFYFFDYAQQHVFEYKNK